jgi:hypothetical protein
VIYKVTIIKYTITEISSQDYFTLLSLTHSITYFRLKLGFTHHSLRPGPEEELGDNVSGSDIWCLTFPSEQSAGEWLLKQTFTGDFIYATRRWCSLRNKQTHAIQLDMSLAPFSFATLLLRGKAAKVHRMFFTIQS